MKRKKGKIILALSACGTALAMLPMLSAFEAHVINVTATIENALSVPVEISGINFGNVFPEEVLHKNLDISLSGSFMSDPTVDDVEYMIRQKPKCGLLNDVSPFVPKYIGFAQASHNPDGSYTCPSQRYELLPLLCPYLSKHEVTTDGLERENDLQASTTLPFVSNGIGAFHGPVTDWHLIDSVNWQVTGRLVKLGEDTSDQWDIDLHVPCFKGQCAQDNVIPKQYQADPKDEHQMFGCDLWVEVTNISTPPEKPAPAILTINKIVNNTHGGNNVAANFQLFAVGTTSTQFINGVPQNIPGGFTYTVTEFGVSGYSASFSGDCDAFGQVTLAPGDTKQCTITNNDNPALITLHKVVVNDAPVPGTANASFFTMKIDGSNVPQDTSVAVTSNSSHFINETWSIAGYHFVSITGTGCPAATSTPIVLDEGQSITCTITNSDNGGAQ